ncbi:hypothetical protein [Halalkalibacter urbisdiaboli]|uniref:hypothetical protein n=1 Tax=Halalkalibacter urbisdiaboli TaxID=1960589 RepID=UPI0013FD6178|nr:hypothetical protein [Halalkalibacter urbisdiaboli]
MTNQKSGNDVGTRGESFHVYSVDARKTDFEASYEYASGNRTAKSRSKVNDKQK